MQKVLKSFKLQTVRQRCLIYWVDDRLVSIEPLSSVVEKNQVKEGAVCKIKWKGKGPYLGKLIKISADSKVLREEQFKLEEALFKVTDPQEGQSSPRQDECIASTKGRKRTKPRKLLEATDVEEEETADKALLPPPTKKAKETKAKMSKLSAKVDAQRAVFEQYLKESPTYTSTSTGEPEPAIDIPIPEPIISNTDNAMLPSLLHSQPY
ncbi:hypothetical protein BSL78_22836 [Apostichopus japonicus]|uniref:Uncharacterized protein n=1 Tax=Stichopus japonicus TaxID=307972 RepID=A0A2G8JX68_STIJA|nr:hypothetical protein BSL78_22836 [Apostichopus japonicus]